MPQGHPSNDDTVANISRRRFLQHVLLNAPLCAWWLAHLPRSTVHAQPDYKLLNGGCL
jgi:hypothetical protein